MLIAAVGFLDVDSPFLLDPYWTIVGYYNSLKELAKASMWANAEIKERYNNIYKMYKDKNLTVSYKRLEQANNFVELTSRADSNTITKDLKRLENGNCSDEYGNKSLDFCFATNMISVGVDIDRLGLMVINGQPKTTSEYIQASSRVGRNDNNPGLVFTLYVNTKTRDRSHFEMFQDYHSKIYSKVEPTSVTPFSEPLIRRVLHTVVISLVEYFRLEKNIPLYRVPSEDLIKKIDSLILERVKKINPEAIDDVKKMLKNIFEKWDINRYDCFEDRSKSSDKKPLIYRAGMNVTKQREDESFKLMMSMRSVDKESIIKLKNIKK
jgi:superfamily II DNA/RNA helicase